MPDDPFAPFVGVPWADRGRSPAGYDCWGLFVAAFFAGSGIVLPSHADDYSSAFDRAEVARVYHGEVGDWGEVPAGEERPLDCAVLRVTGCLHVGLIVRRNRVLHVQPGRTSIIERLDRYADRLTGVYRHRELI